MRFNLQETKDLAASLLKEDNTAQQERPSDVNEEFWILLQAALDVVYLKEKEEMDVLLIDLVIAQASAEGCGCPTCRSRAKRAMINIQIEIKRRTRFNPKDQFDKYGRDQMEADIALGMKNIREHFFREAFEDNDQEFTQRNIEWDQRTARLREIIKLVRENQSGKHILEPSVEKKLRTEITKLVTEMRIRRSK